MTNSRRKLIKKAREILKQRGFMEGDTYEEFWFKNYQIDIVGWNSRRKVAVECGYCSPRKKLDLERFFDEVICLSKRPETEPGPYELLETSSNTLERMRLMLFKDNNVIFEVPLSKGEWSRKPLMNELSIMEQDLQQTSDFFDALSHKNRLKMMNLLIEEDVTVRFAEFTHSLDLNPKLVWENTKKLSECGLIERSENGRYRCSEFGKASFILLSFTLRYLREMFENSEGR